MKHMMHASQCFAYKSLTCDFLWLQCAVFLRRTTVSDLCRQVVVSDPQSWFMEAVADQLMQSQLDDWSEDSQVKRLILLLLPWWLNEMSRSGTGYRPTLFSYILARMRGLRDVSTAFIMIMEKRDLTDFACIEESLCHWPTVAAWWSSRVTMLGPAQEPVSPSLSNQQAKRKG